MRTLRATVEYDGSGFSGFQRQSECRTVQGTLEIAISKVVGSEASIVGAGRTDSGVHARGQVVSFRADTSLDDRVIMRAVNARLPVDVVLHTVTTVPETFHATKMACERVYEYCIYQGSQRSPLERERAWYIPRLLDVELMRQGAECLLGSHDFSAFCVGPQTQTRRCIRAAVVWREGDSVFVRIAGNAFLHRMVRRIVGTLARVGLGDLQVADMEGLLRGGKRSEAGPAAPAHGLTLIHVAYPEDKAVEMKCESGHVVA